MFTKIEVDNFLSYKHLTWNLKGKGKKGKALSIVFGANGVGKSDICYSVLILKELLGTLRIGKIATEFLQNPKIFEAQEDSKKTLLEVIGLINSGSERIYNNAHIAGSDEPIHLKYEFVIKGREGIYEIEISQNGIENERLDFQLESNRTMCFSLQAGQKRINEKLFKKNEVYKNVVTQVDQLWGKHSFFAILLNEFDTKSHEFMDDSLNKEFDSLLVVLSNISGTTDPDKKDRYYAYRMTENVSEFSVISGFITEKELFRLNELELCLTELLHGADIHYKRVFFKTNVSSPERIDYELMVTKTIGDEDRTFSFGLESTGIKKLVSIFLRLPRVLRGETIVLDEIDSGIHLSFIVSLLSQFNEKIKNSNAEGQLIVTTHALGLLNPTIKSGKKISPDCFYFLLQNERGDKKIMSIKDFKYRTFEKSNILDLYLRGDKYIDEEYISLPSLGEIDFDSLVNHYLKSVSKE